MRFGHAAVALCAVTMLCAPASAQEEDRTANSTIFLEGLGPGVLYSINYERLVLDPLAVRVGFSYFSFSATSGSETASAGFFMIPITASYVGLYSGSHGLEVGGGATLFYATLASSGVGLSTTGSGVAAYGTAHVGYRVHPLDGGFNFRIGLMALFGPGFGGTSTDSDGQLQADFGVAPWGYLSLGYSF
ncbi:MAG: hypothetical protein ACI9WU_000922 [Myxococcota bacterium]|jgi:hypothetical protein